MDAKAFQKYLATGEYVATEDQDTAVSDSFVEAAVMVYQAANMVNRCIAEHNPWGIDLEEIRDAELALAYVQGIRHGLALDNKMDREYLLYMEKSVASMKESRATGFRFPVYVPPNPFEILNIVQRDFINRKSYATRFSPPSEKEIAEAQKETDKVKNGNCPYTRDPYKNTEPSGENLPENPKSGLNEQEVKAQEVVFEAPENPKKELSKKN